LKFHDLHHIMSGYGIDRIGESEISAWELGSRSCRKPLISIMNLFALSTGFILSPQKVITAFYRGCRSRNLYYMSDGISEEAIDQLDIMQMKTSHLEISSVVRYKWLRNIEFSGYIFISMIIHVMMLIAGKILLTAEWIKNRLVKPKMV